MDETSPCVTQMGSTSKRSTTKKNVIKKTRSTKNKKKLFDELSFVEDHQETFYIGLNENIMGAYNPVTAKTINYEEATDLAKNWVKPDEELRLNKITKKFHKDFCKVTAPKQHRANIRSLTFLEDEVESNYPNDLNELMSNGNQADSEKHGILQNILDNVNTTQFNDREITLLTPEKHKVYVSDTPVEYYGLSMLERKIRGID